MTIPPSRPPQAPSTASSTPPPLPSTPRVQQADGERVAALRHVIGRVVIGQPQVVDQTIACFLAGGHVLLEGVPGLGKTLLGLALSRAVGGSFSRVQFTPDLMPSDITGHVLYDQKAGEFRVRKGPVFANLLLADEINRAPAKTQAALLELMQEQQVTIEGTPYPLPTPFMTVATQNPIEHEGTYPLPEAQLDRFLLNVRVEYPTEEAEAAIVRGSTQGSVGDALDVSAVQPVIDIAGAQRLQQAAAAVLVDERVMHYAVSLVRSTRGYRGLAIGAGPRGAIALIRVARAHALMHGRDFVTPDDIKTMVLPTLRHRVVVTPELEVEGLSLDELLRSIIESVEAPRQ